MNEKLQKWIKFNGLAAILLLGMLLIIIFQHPEPIIIDYECPAGQELVCQDTYDINFTYNVEEINNGNKNFNTNTQRTSNRS